MRENIEKLTFLFPESIIKGRGVVISPAYIYISSGSSTVIYTPG